MHLVDASDSDKQGFMSGSLSLRVPMGILSVFSGFLVYMCPVLWTQSSAPLFTLLGCNLNNDGMQTELRLPPFRQSVLLFITIVGPPRAAAPPAPRPSPACCLFLKLYICSVQFSHSVVFDSLRPHEPQHARPPSPSPTPRVHPNPCPLSRWCHPTISSSVFPFSSCPQSFPASGSFPMSQLFTSGGQSMGVSASTSVLPMNSQDWFSLG